MRPVLAAGEPEGPVVAQMQAVFMDNWIKATGRVLHSEAYFPALQPHGSAQAQMFSSSPTGGSESMRLMYPMAITAARGSIHLSSSYFVPDELTVNALVAAARRGVKIRIVTPGTDIDSRPCKFQLRVKATCIAEFGRPVGWSTNRARASSSETSDTLALIRPGIASLSKTKKDRLAARRAIARSSHRML